MSIETEAEVDNIPPFYLRDYLTQKEEANYKLMKGRLREFFEEGLLCYDFPSNFESTRLILNLYGRYSKWQETIGDAFLLALLRGTVDDITPSLKKLGDIIDKELADLFFAFATTSKSQYYSAETIVEMVDLFIQAMPLLPGHVTLPSYDAGGKEMLLELLEKPKRQEQVPKDEPCKPSELTPLFDSLSQEDFEAAQPKLFRYLGSLSAEKRLPVATYATFIKNLKQAHPVVKNVALALALVLTTDGQKPIAKQYTEHDLLKLSRAVQALYEREGGVELLESAWSLPLRDGASLEDVLRFFTLAEKVSSDELIPLISKRLSFPDLVSKLEVLILSKEQLSGDSNDDPAVLRKRFSGKGGDASVIYALPKEILAKVIQQYTVVQEYCQKYQHVHMDELVTLAARVKREYSGEDASLHLLAIGRLAMRLHFNVYPYSTQVCIVLAQLALQKNIVAQVKTGEGKTLIVALQAFVLAHTRSGQGHIISSDHELSRRDQQDYVHFFKAFGIKTLQIKKDSRKTSEFAADILYGTATDYEFALMREMLLGVQLFPRRPTATQDKPFSWVLVDELDNLTIDTALNGARLSFEAEVAFDWVYEPIFHFIKDHFPSKQRVEKVLNSSPLLATLRNHLSAFQGAKFARLVADLSDRKLSLWVQSACTALFDKHEKHEYVIQKKKVVIVDAKNTGRRMSGSRWSFGVHEFLEIKHSIDVERESVCPISINHSVFYPLYESLFGYTGTLGSKTTRDELKALYGIESFDAPTHKPQIRTDMPIHILDTDEECYSHIEDSTAHHVHLKRPHLILCETIEDTERLSKRFTARGISYLLLNDMQEMEDKTVLEQAGKPGAVIIATNVAGRGTDFKPDEESIANGGLHVTFTFDPDSDRVEFQGRGRAGRQGNPGTSAIIVSKERLARRDPVFASLNTEEAAKHLTSRRGQREIKAKELHIFYATAERQVFSLVKKFYEMINRFCDKKANSFMFHKLATLLNNRRIVKQERDFSKLSRKKEQIALEAMELLTSFGDQVARWKSFVEKLVGRIREEMIHDFALHFYDVVSEKIKNSETLIESQVNSWIQEVFNKDRKDPLLNIVDFQIKAMADAHQEKLEREIHDTFEQELMKWKRSLDPSGLGVLDYLSKMLNIDLSPLEVDRF